MNEATSPVPGKGNSAAGAGAVGGPKVVRFFSVEGQRRRLEFAKMRPARAMTPEEETRYLGELQAQEEAARKKVQAEETAARERVAREKAARSRAASAGRGGRAGEDRADGRSQPAESAAGDRSWATRGRHAAEQAEESASSEGHRSGGRRAATGSGDAPTAGRVVPPAQPSSDPLPHPAVTRSEIRRGIVSRRGVIGAPRPRDEE
jgi:hypothetical protein